MSAAQIKITIELEYKSGVRKLSESLVIPEEWSHMEADNMGTVEWQRVVDLTQIMDRRNGKDRLAELIAVSYTHLTPSNEYVLPCLTNIQQTTSDEGNFHGKLV